MPKIKKQVKENLEIQEKTRSQEVREQLLSATKQIEKTYINVTVLAYEVYKDRLYQEWGYDDIKEGDSLEIFKVVQVKRMIET